MKSIYEKPVAKLVDFDIDDSIMNELDPLSQDPEFSEGVEDW